jgi:hypothetical protein
LALTPFCLSEGELPSSGIEQLDISDPNYMQFENHKTRYSLDLRDILGTLSGQKHPFLNTTYKEAVHIFGWAEVYKD